MGKFAIREPDELRAVEITAGIAPHATGSVLMECGNTRVICACTVDKSVPKWMQAEGASGGWLTAEYSMLPYSTLERKTRDIAKGKQDGRSIEIQRLIGRSLRAVTDLSKLPGLSLWLDCDVLQADGGTRTASITGAYVAAQLAVQQLLEQGQIAENPFREAVAAVSVGVVEGECYLDLDYGLDRAASVDANVVMTASGQFVEVQMTGEEATFTRAQHDRLLELAAKGIQKLLEAQQDALAAES